MPKIFSILLLLFAICVQATDGEDQKYQNWRAQMEQSEPNTIDGEVEIIDDFEMPELGRSRTLRIFLPEGYRNSDNHYPVIYMHDGQNLFDEYTSYVGEWKIDETINGLVREGKWDGAIVVGIDNGQSLRIDEYSPWRNNDRGDGGEGAQYVDFLVKTLKPWVDQHYRTLPDRDNTMIAGSSMGGLISLYAGMKYPEVYSKLGLFSPAFWYAKQPLLDFLDTVSIDHDFRIYIDSGTLEGKSYVSDATQIRMILRQKGVMDCRLVIDGGAQHNEAAWARRFPAALLWLINLNP